MNTTLKCLALFNALLGVALLGLGLVKFSVGEPGWGWLFLIEGACCLGACSLTASDNSNIPPELEKSFNKPFITPDQVEDPDENVRTMIAASYNTGRTVSGYYDEAGTFHMEIWEKEEGK